MRRKDREIVDIELVKEFIDEEDVVRFALTDDEGTYIVPVNYGLEEDGDKLYLYVHGAGAGRKASALARAAESGALIPFEIDGQHAPELDDGCNASYYFMSVMGNVTVEVIEGEEKLHALEVIMDGIMPAPDYHFEEGVVARTSLWRFTIQDWSCKKH